MGAQFLSPNVPPAVARPRGDVALAWRAWCAPAMLAAAAVALAASTAEARPSAPVPPSMEIEILDPRVDPLGNPTVLLGIDPCDPTQQLIDMPQTILVHRYYYTGDRSFQGPMLTGGPTIVVVNHPRTGERVYVSVQMLPGAPRVTYTNCSIRYEFGENAITVKFGLLGKPTVVYRNGVARGSRAKEAAVGAAAATAELTRRTGLPAAVEETARGCKNLAVNTADTINAVGRAVLAPAVQIIGALPVGAAFQANPEEQARIQRDHEVRRAAAAASREGGSIATLR